MPSNPDRDRRLARLPRRGFRAAEDVKQAIGDLLGGEEGRRMRRFQRVAPALREVLDDRMLARVRPVRIVGGTLVLEVDDGMALHELRQHRAHALLEALSSSGTGVTKLVWRLAGSRGP